MTLIRAKSFALSWYLVDTLTGQTHFIATNKNSRFIFIGNSSDCDVRLSSRKSPKKASEPDEVQFVAFVIFYFYLAPFINQQQQQIEDQHALIFYDNLENKITIKDMGTTNGVRAASWSLKATIKSLIFTIRLNIFSSYFTI